MLSFKIALRYLFAPKSHSAINTITLVAACGVSIITAAMICMLSVYNGFEGLVSNLTSRFDPQLRVEATEGKTFEDSDAYRSLLLAHPDVETVNATLEETILLSYGGRQVPARMKGVDSTFAQVTDIENILLGTEGFLLKDEVVDYCIPGAGLASVIGINRGFIRPLTLYCPRRKGKISLTNPEEAFAEASLFCSNVFMVQQADYDSQYLLCSLDVARKLLGDSLLTSAYEIKLRDGAKSENVKRDLTPQLDGLQILTQHEQQADAYRIMQIEKWITFLLVIFILLIATFNAIGALSMLIIDKESQIATLRNLGADSALIRRIFTCEGWLITGFGAAGGILLGIVLCLLQQHYGIIGLGGSDSSHYVVSSYPVILQWGDVLLTICTVAIVGWLSTYYTISLTKPDKAR